MRNFRKSLGMFGWDAGIRTPIRRSRVLLKALKAKRIKSLARQIKEKSGKIRNTAAMKLRGILKKRRYLETLPASLTVGVPVLAYVSVETDRVVA